MQLIQIFLLILGVLTASSPAATPALWIISEKKISFYSPDRGIQELEGITPKSSLVDPATCTLWVQSENHLLQVLPSFQIKKDIVSSEALLGSETIEGLFISFTDKHWSFRNLEGNIVETFPSLASHPTQLQGTRKAGFWSLDFQEDENRLDLISFNAQGKHRSSWVISDQPELWSEPRLNWVQNTDQLWISYTASSMAHAYSPIVELWNTKGEKLKTLAYSDRGILLDTCTTVNHEFLLARDIPSSPYTVPLFSFLELLTSSEKPKSLYQGHDNNLISSIQCRSNAIWTLQKSVLGGQSTLLVELSPKMEEKNVLPLKEPAWKIHACSLQ